MNVAWKNDSKFKLVHENIGEGFTLFDEKTTVENLAEYIQDVVKKDKWVKIAVGTDSKFRHASKQWKKNRVGAMEWVCHFYTVVDFAHNGGGKGSHLIVRRELLHGREKYSKFDRLWKEVVMSVDLAKWIFDNTGIVVEIHFDLNQDEKWESNKLLAAALGYAAEFGFPSKCKPDAASASKGADHFVKKNHGEDRGRKARKKKKKFEIKIAL